MYKGRENVEELMGQNMREEVYEESFEGGVREGL